MIRVKQEWVSLHQVLLIKQRKVNEVLFMVDALDEYVVDQMKEFERNNLISSTKESLKFDESGDGMVSKNQTGFLLIDEDVDIVYEGPQDD
ncbi:hypothetical protein VitviT2T_005242 [Vitis vinifera]|uniref:Uncharacterized protein n=2 Tax=Vitis vinifera TaxID=29760 RepID=A0ABY9BRZ4_VITVI|nr:hypothetical protein VitviT2T_005242 [Vitis vinifera]